MIDLFIWGVIIILTMGTSAIGIVLAVYFMIVKKGSRKMEDSKYTLNDQKEIN